MKPDFGEVVDQLAVLAQPFVEIAGGHLQPPPEWGEEAIIRLELGIYWMSISPMFPHGAYVCTDEASIRLLQLVLIEHDPAAFELARKIGAHRLALGEELPEGVKILATLYLSGEIERPKQIRRNKSFLRAMSIYTLIRVAQGFFGLTLTRNDEAINQESACDAAVAALARVGHHVSYRAAKELAVGSKPENVRLRADWERRRNAVAAAKARDPIARISMPPIG